MINALAKHRKFLVALAGAAVVILGRHFGQSSWEYLDASVLLMPLVGYEVRRDARDARVLRAADGHGVRIAPECDGMPPVLLFLAAVLVSPVPWRRRLLFGALGSLGILLLNQVRIGHLLWLSDRSPDVFHDAHEAWWPTGLVAAAGVMFLLWARRNASPAP